MAEEMGSPRALQKTGLWIAAVAIGVGFIAYMGYQKVRSHKISQLKVVSVDTEPLDWIKDESLLENLYLLAQQSFEGAMRDGKASELLAMTLYSLFKQHRDGPADEFEKNKQKTDPIKYAAWLQQGEKSDLQCIKEYILLAGQIDKQFNDTVRAVASGTIREININKSDKANMLEKSVSLPKRHDDTDYLSQLNKSEKDIFELYKGIEDNKDQKKLIELVRSGELKPTDVNKEGQTPLMLAVDSNFSSATISSLIDLGCDVNACGDDGMTPLHKSYWIENPDTFKLLLEKGANPKLADNEGDTGHSLAQDSQKFLTILQQVMDSPLAVSMTKSQFEQSEESQSQAAQQK